MVTDYDQTLTKAKFADGHSCDSSFKTIITYPGMPDNIRELAASLYHKYYPIEQDVTLTKDKKLPYLKEWWQADMTAFSSVAFSRADFEEMTR